jgi:hypothetical protein
MDLRQLRNTIIHYHQGCCCVAEILVGSASGP